jgi:hypothetical protein
VRLMIPLVRNTDRQPHNPLAMRDLEDAIFGLFEGLTGPERLYRIPPPVPGKYTDRSKNRIEDENHRFLVALPRSRLDELRRVLKRACNTFDQETIYLSVKGTVELVDAKPEDGFLGGAR